MRRRSASASSASSCPGLTGGAEYIYVKTDHLQRNRELNLPAPTIRPTDLAQRPFFGIASGVPRPLTALGSVQVRESTAESEYNALASHRARPQAVGPGVGELRAQQVDVGRRQRARLGRAGRGELVRPRPRMGAGAHGSAPPVQRLRAVLPAAPRRRDARASARFRAGPSTRRSAPTRAWATATASTPIGRTARRASRSSATPSATRRSRKSTCARSGA